MKSLVKKLIQNVVGGGKTVNSGRVDYFDKYLGFLQEEGLYPEIRCPDGPSFDPIVKINGKEYLSFSSNNYLGLAGNEEVKTITKSFIDKYGVGSGSTRLLAGSLDAQIRFEKELADFFGMADSITFSSGYLANVGVIRMLVDPFPYFQLEKEEQGLILSDRLNHASMIDGVRLAKAKRLKYTHNDMSALRQLLEENKGVSRKLILTDGVFSMDGDLARLPDIVELAKKYDALLFVDDSHGVGVLGPHGEGTPAHLGVAKDIDVLMGSFTKAFGSIGGFVATKDNIGKYLRITARSFIFSDPIPPAIVEGLITTTRLIKNGSQLRNSATSNAEHLRVGLKKTGFTVHGEVATIVPLIIGSEKTAIAFSQKMMERNILAPCIRRPAVEEGKERIRFSVMANHSRDQIGRLLSVCKEVGKEVGLI